jgi:hypothetical protein
VLSPSPVPEDVRFHAAAGVAYRQQDMRSFSGAQVSPQVFIFHLDPGRFDHDAAAFGHGFAGVHHEVHDHLLELHRIALDPG